MFRYWYDYISIMKYREILLNQLKPLPYADRAIIRHLSKQYGLKEGTVDAYIKHSLARKDLIQLKKSMYVTTDFYEKNISDISYKFYIANVLKTPSYVSSWAALQYYDLTTEVIANVISVTPKITRMYTNRVGNFSYHSIKKDLFSGFSLVKGKFDFFIASPAKALFDLLYFRTHQFRGIHLEMIAGMVDELRIDIDEMDKKERAAFYAMIKKYLEHYE